MATTTDNLNPDSPASVLPKFDTFPHLTAGKESAALTGAVTFFTALAQQQQTQNQILTPRVEIISAKDLAAEPITEDTYIVNP